MREGRVVGFEEKPAEPKSDLIPIGVYFLRPDVFDVIEGLAPSGRGEFEITDVLNHYIPGGGLFTQVYDGHWTDAGTVPSLLRAAELAAADDAEGRPRPTRRPDRWADRSHDGPRLRAAAGHGRGRVHRLAATSATSWPGATGRWSRSSTS